MKLLVILMIQFPICRAYIVEGPSNVASKEGSHSVLKCSLSGNPTDGGLWKFRSIGTNQNTNLCDKNICNNPSKHKLSFTPEGKYDLEIKDISKSDAGVYTCSDGTYENEPGAALVVILMERFFSSVSSFDVPAGEVVNLEHVSDIYEDGKVMVENVEWFGPDEKSMKEETKFQLFSTKQAAKLREKLLHTSATVTIHQSGGSYKTSIRLKIDKSGIANNSVEYFQFSPEFRVRNPIFETLNRYVSPVLFLLEIFFVFLNFKIFAGNSSLSKKQE